MVEVQGLTKLYKEKAALSEIDFRLEKQDFMVLFGPEDAGKTSFLQILMGYDLNYSGKVKVLGETPNRWKRSVFTQVRFVPKDVLLVSELTVGNYISMAGNMAEHFDWDQARELCRKYEIPVKNYLTELTYRENKLVQIIAAGCANPQLLLLDDPFGSLDRPTFRLVLEELQSWNRNGMSILITAEHYEDVRGFVKSFAFLKDGVLVKCAPVPEDDYRDKVITMEGGHAPMLQDLISEYMGNYNGRHRFAYRGSMSSLLKMLELSHCEDAVVEELTLQEELEHDFSRWE